MFKTFFKLAYFSLFLMVCGGLFSVRGESEVKRALHSLLDRLLKFSKVRKKCCGKENPEKLGKLSWSFKEIIPKVQTDLEKVELDCYLEKLSKAGIINTTTALISGKQFQAALVSDSIAWGLKKEFSGLLFLYRFQFWKQSLLLLHLEKEK